MKFPLVTLVLLLSGCGVFHGTPETATPSGMRVLSDVQLTLEQLAILDDSLSWAQTHGLAGDPRTITVLVKVGTLTPGGNYGFRSASSPTGWDGGNTLSYNPIIIQLATQHLENLRHEFLHCILFQKTGDSDAQHSLPIWKELGQF